MSLDLELPIVAATTSPKEAFQRMQEHGRSGLVYFVKGAPYLVHSKALVRGIVTGQETIARVQHVQIGRQKVAPKRGARALGRPRATIVHINEDTTSAQIIFRSEARQRRFGGPPLKCQCRGPYGHEAPHDEHGPTCRKDGKPFDCARD
jgi:hypothetical protein